MCVQVILAPEQKMDQRVQELPDVPFLNGKWYLPRARNPSLGYPKLWNPIPGFHNLWDPMLVYPKLWDLMLRGPWVRFLNWLGNLVGVVGSPTCGCQKRNFACCPCSWDKGNVRRLLGQSHGKWHHEIRIWKNIAVEIKSKVVKTMNYLQSITVEM